MKKAAIIQSCYIPWKGYFDIIHDVDLFIFLDDVQVTTRDWRNRNKIKTPNGTLWLTIPIGHRDHKLIYEIQLTDKKWQKKHWKTIAQFYSKADYFRTYSGFFEYVYLGKEWDSLSELNQFLIKTISTEFLGIKTEFVDSRQLSVTEKNLDRLICLLKKADAGVYISGPSARNYIDEKAFDGAGIKLIYKDYTGYPEYPQFFPPFAHDVSILDLLFHAGPDAPYFIWGWCEKISKNNREPLMVISEVHGKADENSI